MSRTTEIPKSIGLIIFLMGLVLLTSCGNRGNGGNASEGPISVRAIVTAIGLSNDGLKVETITIRTDEGDVLSLRVSDEIDPTVWSPVHLEGHIQLGQGLGFTIGVLYQGGSDQKVAVELSE